MKLQDNTMKNKKVKTNFVWESFKERDFQQFQLLTLEDIQKWNVMRFFNRTHLGKGSHSGFEFFPNWHNSGGRKLPGSWKARKRIVISFPTSHTKAGQEIIICKYTICKAWGVIMDYLCMPDFPWVNWPVKEQLSTELLWSMSSVSK